jgi:hypothetical protein
MVDKIKVQNVCDHALDLTTGVLSPAESAQVKRDATVENFLAAGLLIELKPDKATKGDAK